METNMRQRTISFQIEWLGGRIKGPTPGESNSPKGSITIWWSYYTFQPMAKNKMIPITYSVLNVTDWSQDSTCSKLRNWAALFSTNTIILYPKYLTFKAAQSCLRVEPALTGCNWWQFHLYKSEMPFKYSELLSSKGINAKLTMPRVLMDLQKRESLKQMKFSQKASVMLVCIWQ